MIRLIRQWICGMFGHGMIEQQGITWISQNKGIEVSKTFITKKCNTCGKEWGKRHESS